MADATRLAAPLLDVVPPHVGWFRCTPDVRTDLILNGAMLSVRPAAFPLAARIRLFRNGEPTASQDITGIALTSHRLVNLNDLLDGGPIEDGYYEVTVACENPEAMVESFFGEIWSSVYSRDGRTAFNIPLLNTRGVDVAMLDPLKLYYPGLTVDATSQPALITVNHYAFPVSGEVVVYDAAGQHHLSHVFTIPPKTSHRLILDEAIAGLGDLLASGPGLLIFNQAYKLNSYILLSHRQTGMTTGLDHLGFLMGASVPGPGHVVPLDDAIAHRMDDRLVCYCRSLPESHLRTLLATGQDLPAIQEKTGAGKVCAGCVADLREIAGQAN